MSDVPATEAPFDPPGPRLLARVRAFAEALFASEAGAPPAERLDALSADFADFVSHAGLRARLLFTVCAFVVTWIAPLLALRLPPLGRLPVATRVAILAEVEHGLLAFAVLGLKAILCILYYEQPDARAEMGADTSCLRSDP